MNQKYNSIKELRESYIEELDSNPTKERFLESNADNLLELGLSMYSKDFSFESMVYSAFSVSKLNNDIVLHPEQLKVLKTIESNKASIISAPTSFGKTFCVYEYLARNKPRNVVLVVPTLALTKEYMMRFLKTYSDVFSEYCIYSSIDENMNYDFDNNYNIFILTHERATSFASVQLIKRIDFLVIDEVYKLDTKMGDNDRTLIFNVAYYYLSKLAEKYVLLAPFIGGVTNIEDLEKKPVFLRSNFSPVVNKIEDRQVSDEGSRFAVCDGLLNNECSGQKTMVYFVNPQTIEKYVNEVIVNKNDINLPDDAEAFYRWASREIHRDWSVVKALRKGYVIHHGKLPNGIRNYLLSLFDNRNSLFNTLLCTTTLLEGVNTEAKNLIITKAKKVSANNHGQQFAAFDFYNLAGRTGRLYKYYIGYTYYLKSDTDPEYDLKDAELKITFEITERNQDIEIHTNSGSNEEVINYLGSKGLTLDDYVNGIGTPIRLEKFKIIRKNYEENIASFKNSVDSHNTSEAFRLMNNKIIRVDENFQFYGIISNIISARHKSVYEVVETVKNFKSMCGKTVDEVVSLVLNIKNSYLEHTFLTRCKIIKMFLEKEGNNNEYIDFIERRYISPIEEMFYLKSPHKKMLKSLDIYDADIDIIINKIGDDFGDIKELKKRLIKYKDKYFDSISFISQYIVNNLL